MSVRRRSIGSWGDMKSLVRGSLVIVVSWQGVVSADEHIVPVAESAARLNAAAAQRKEEIAVLQGFLDTAEARRACDTAHIACARLERQLPLLRDEELRDLSRRAARLKTDPVAGMGKDGKNALIIAGVTVVLLATLVIWIHSSGRLCFAGCS